MPDPQAVKALTIHRESVREALNQQLRRDGYDVAQLDALPEPGDCPCALAVLIRDWQDVNQRLDLAVSRTTGGPRR